MVKKGKNVSAAEASAAVDAGKKKGAAKTVAAATRSAAADAAHYYRKRYSRHTLFAFEAHI